MNRHSTDESSFQALNRHFDRSVSQSHRETRSGEICFSTPASHQRQNCLYSNQTPKKKWKKMENFQPQISTINSPQFTTIPPQIHHQKTTRCTRLFPKHPSKTPTKQQNPGSHRGFIFFLENPKINQP
jgi:hypothetical protein